MATLAQYQARFEELLKNKTSFHNESSYSYRSIYDNTIVANSSPSVIIIQLDDKKFNFEQKHFDKFINGITYMKSNSYIVTCYYNSIAIRNKAIDIMFNKFSPNEKQFALLCACYSKRSSSSSSHEWVDTLKKRNYDFTKEQITMLKKIGYNIGDLIKDKDLCVEELENLLETVQNTDYNTIEKIINKNKLVPSLKCLLNVLNSLNWHTYYDSNKQTTENNKLLELLTKAGAKSTKECMQIYKNKGYNDFDLFKILINSGVEPDTELIDYLSKNSYCPHLILAIEKLTEVDTKIMNIILDKLTSYNLIVNKYIMETYFDVKLPNTLNIFSYLIDKGVKPNEETMEIICKRKSIDVFEKLIKDYKILPNKKCLDACMNGLGQNCKMLIEILNYKIIPDYETFSNLMKSNYLSNDFFLKIFEFLINYGLQVNLDTVNCAARNKIVIPNLERFNIDYDERLYFICYKNNYWPDEYTSKFTVDKKVLELRTLCYVDESNRKEQISLDKIKEFMKNNNVKPDRYCIESVLKENEIIFEYFNETLKCEASVMCLRHLVNSAYEQRLPSDLIDKLYKETGVDHEYMMKTYDHIDLKKL